MSGKASKVIAAFAAAVLVAGGTSNVAFARSWHHVKAACNVQAQAAACCQNGICTASGSCDQNGVCVNGGICAGSLCYQDGACATSGTCPNGGICDGTGYRTGACNGSGLGQQAAGKHHSGHHR